MGRETSENVRSPEEERKIVLEANAKSAASEKHPERNEDAVLVDAEGGIFGVFDGVGGGAAGETAARLARDFVGEKLKEISRELSLDETKKELEKILIEASRRIGGEAEKNRDKRGMGTTASVVLIRHEDQKEVALVGNVGDSRVYLERVGGEFKKITLDDSLLRGWARGEEQARALEEKLGDTEREEELAPEEQAIFRMRNVVTQVLGSSEEIQPRIHEIDLEAGDRLLITSDGIHDNLTQREMAGIAEETKNSEDAVLRLVEAAKARSHEAHLRAKPDDMSAIVVDIAEKK